MRWSWISFAVGMLVTAALAVLCWMTLTVPHDVPRDAVKELPERWLAPPDQDAAERQTEDAAETTVVPRRERAHVAPDLGDVTDDGPPPVDEELSSSGPRLSEPIQLEASSFVSGGRVAIRFGKSSSGSFVITSGPSRRDPSKGLLEWAKERAKEALSGDAAPDPAEAARLLSADSYAERVLGLGLALRTQPLALGLILDAVRDEQFPDLRGAALRGALERARRSKDVHEALLDAALASDTALRRVAIENLGVAGDDGVDRAAAILLSGDHPPDLIGPLARTVGQSTKAASFLAASPPAEAAMMVVSWLVKRLEKPKTDEDRELASSLPGLVRPLLDTPEAENHATSTLPQLARLGHGAFLREIASSSLLRPAVRAAAVTAALGTEETQADGVAAAAAVLTDPTADVDLVRRVLEQLGPERPDPFNPGQMMGVNDATLRGALAAATRTHPSAWVRELALEKLAEYDSTSVGALVVHRAMYGASGHLVDVTDALRGAIVRNRLEVVANNDLGGDPQPGSRKTLRVEYSVGGVRRLRTVGEGGTLTLP